MKDLARRLGLGRLAYALVHRPAGAIGDSLRAGGPLEQWRTATGRRAMRTFAAAQLSPLPEPPPDAPEICLLTGRSLWYQTAFFLASLARFQPVRPVIFGDGSLDADIARRLRRVIPFARIVASAESEEQLDRSLPEARYPWLRRRRRELVLFRKFMDVRAGHAGWRLFCDSDMLVFHRPERLISWLRSPAEALHMADVTQAYGYEMRLLEELADGPVPDRVNTGALALHDGRIDWDRLEYSCRTMVERAGTHYYQEQALMALLLAEQPHAVLPASDYVVLPSAAEARDCRAVLHHYVAGSKAPYFRHNWRRVLP